MALFFAYSSALLFDQQRVKDPTAHAVVPEMNRAIFAGFAPEDIAALRAEMGKLRAPESPAFKALCAQLASKGPPDYRPDYMIRRGEMALRNPEDWQVAGFDAEAAWRRALVEINGCPAP